jgi:hypothetical protein
LRARNLRAYVSGKNGGSQRSLLFRHDQFELLGLGFRGLRAAGFELDITARQDAVQRVVWPEEKRSLVGFTTSTGVLYLRVIEHDIVGVLGDACARRGYGRCGASTQNKIDLRAQCEHIGARRVVQAHG